MPTIPDHKRCSSFTSFTVAITVHVCELIKSSYPSPLGDPLPGLFLCVWFQHLVFPHFVSFLGNVDKHLRSRRQ